MRPICFISDYGLADDRVGSCKGVIASIAPQTTVIDLTHGISGFDITRGAEILRNATRYMPEDTVYLAVIDPGLKSKRQAIAIQARSGAHLVGPDNGLLLPAAGDLGGIEQAVHLTNPRYHITPVSDAFQGRDIFSSVAAHLAAGVSLRDLGDEVDPASLVSTNFPEAQRAPDGGLTAEIIDIDRFGNVRLSATQKDLDLQYGAPVEIRVRDEVMDARYVRTFGDSKLGDLVVVPDSHWRLSLAINQGNAARALLLSLRDRVRVDPAPTQ